MKYVLIRDDDLNFHTSFEMLNVIYGFLFEQGIPVNFSTIPAVNGAAKTKDFNSGEEIYEPFLPADIAGEERLYPISDNTSLMNDLNAISRVDFLQHGYEHSGYNGLCEFEINDRKKLQTKLDDGHDILSTAFKRRPTTFVAPQDKYSLTAISEIQKRFDTLSLGWLDKTRLPKSYLPAYYWMKLCKKNRIKQQDFLLTEHPGCHYSRYFPRSHCDPILDSYLVKHDITVIVTHHWEFFEDGVLNLEMWQAFRARILSLKQNKKIQFLTFSELYQKC
jgi:hypothetical protein